MDLIPSAFLCLDVGTFVCLDDGKSARALVRFYVSERCGAMMELMIFTAFKTMIPAWRRRDVRVLFPLFFRSAFQVF